jgi:hypothetical protein
MMSPEDLATLVRVTVESVLAATKSVSTGGGGGGGGGTRLDERYFRRVEKFDGGAGKNNWKEFSFQLRWPLGCATHVSGRSSRTSRRRARR